MGGDRATSAKTSKRSPLNSRYEQVSVAYEKDPNDDLNVRSEKHEKQKSSKEDDSSKRKPTVLASALNISSDLQITTP